MRIGVRIPVATSSAIVTALIWLVKIFPMPLVNGVAESPTTAARVCIA